MKKLLSEAIKSIRPDSQYEKEILSKADSIIKKINSGMKGAKAVLGGSSAKGTWLKTFDVDIFVRFDYKKYSNKSSGISDILEKFLKRHFKIARLHGSRDYFQITEGKFTFEVIPILGIKKASEAKNITDVSPLHSDFIKKHRKLVDEIRLTKQFFKSSGIYGAESYIRGFSGYVCEILTINYGSFLNLVKAMSKWKEREVIDIKNYYKGKNVFSEINKSKLASPLVIIDPVQKDRNAAAALDHEKFGIAIHRAKEFLKNPSMEFFIVKEHDEADLRKKFPNIIILKAVPLKKKPDVAGAKMLKAFHQIENELARHGFTIKESDMLWHHGKDSLFYYSLESTTLPESVEIAGPPLFAKQHVDNFRKKHRNTFIKGKKIYAKERRKLNKAQDAARQIIKNPNVMANISKIGLV